MRHLNKMLPHVEQHLPCINVEFAKIEFVHPTTPNRVASFYRLS